MCGIAGRVGRDRLPARAIVERMIDAQSHRGPDGRGLVVRDSATLGHCRLAILDPAGGAQPMANHDRTLWLVYNGEIYNHLELRPELVQRGHRFRTHSDTETLLAAYQEYGTACLDRLAGMFAFALWDARNQQLLLARDRLGIKPLFYAVTDGVLSFASELHALLVDPSVDRTVDRTALDCFFLLRYIPAPLTLFRSVRKLEPGCLLEWRRGRLTHRRYWDLIDLPLDPMATTEVEAAARLREEIDQTVAQYLLSDVPVGALLSGGVDSTFVTAAMACHQSVKTFAVGYAEHPQESELDWAAMAAQRLGTEHYAIRVHGQEVALELPHIARNLDEPVADPAAVPLWFLSRRAQKEVTVVLSGEGGDELWAGYSIYRWMRWMERFRACARLAPLFQWLPSPRLRRALRLFRQPIERRYRGVARAFDPSDLERGAVESLHAVLMPLWDATRSLSPLRRMLYLDTRLWLPDDLLTKADRMTMAAGLELRVPLLDHRIVERAWALPDDFKLRGKQGKWLLRRAARGRVPPPILARPKRGFATPAAAWLRGPLAPYAWEALHGAHAHGFDRHDLEQRFSAHRSGRADHTAELWTLLAIETWQRSLPEVLR